MKRAKSRAEQQRAYPRGLAHHHDHVLVLEVGKRVSLAVHSQKIRPSRARVANTELVIVRTCQDQRTECGSQQESGRTAVAMLGKQAPVRPSLPKLGGTV
jgi:hypothetical protein